MSEIKTNNFEIRLVASAVGVPDLFLEHLSKGATTWCDEPLDEDETEDDTMGFLVPDDSDDEKSDPDDGEDDGEDDEDDDEDADADEGRLVIQIHLTPEAFVEYRHMRDADPEYSITATIIYKDVTGAPVFFHEYECREGMYLTHESGQKNLDTPLLLELNGTYQDCIQFATFAPPHATVMQ